MEIPKNISQNATEQTLPGRSVGGTNPECLECPIGRSNRNVLFLIKRNFFTVRVRLTHIDTTTGAQRSVYTTARRSARSLGAQGPPGLDNGGATGPGKLGDEHVFFIIGLLLHSGTSASVKGKERRKYQVINKHC